MTPDERHCLDTIIAYIGEHRVPPTVRQLAARLGLAGPGSVHRMIVSLERQGEIAREPGRERSIRVTGRSALADVPTEDLRGELRRRGELVA